MGDGGVGWGGVRDAFEFDRLCAGPTLSAGCGLSPPATVNISNRTGVSSMDTWGILDSYFLKKERKTYKC